MNDKNLVVLMDQIIKRRKEFIMYTIIVSDNKEQRTINFKNETQLFYYLYKITNTTTKHIDNEKIYIETSDGISYEYFKISFYGSNYKNERW